MITLLIALVLCSCTALISSPILRAEMSAVLRAGRRAFLVCVSVAIATGYLFAQLHAPTPDRAPATSSSIIPVTTPCPPLRHEVDYAPLDLLDPLSPSTPSELGSDPASGVLQDRVRVLDERARDRRR